MRTLNKRRLGQRGHAHFFMPVLAIAAVAGIGAAYLALSNADSQNCAQMTAVFQPTKTPSVPLSKDGASGGKQYHCIQYIQQMINGAAGYIDINPKFVKDPATVDPSSSSSFAVTTGFGATSSVYDAGVQKWVKWFQGSTASSFAVGSLIDTSHQNLPATGTVDAETWYALCQVNTKIPVADRTTNKATDYDASGKKTHMWYFRSYMRAGYSASVDAGCSTLLKGTGSSSKWQLASSTTVVPNKTSIVTGTKITFTSKITNTGSIATSQFQYSPRYFYASTPPSTVGVYSHELAVPYTIGSATKVVSGSTTVASLIKSGVITLTTQSIIADATKGKYLCGTVATDPKNSDNARNGRSKATCVQVTSTPVSGATWTLMAGSPTVSFSVSSSASSQTVANFQGAVMNQASSKNAAVSYAYGLVYFASSTDNPTLVNGAYPNETKGHVYTANPALQKGQSSPLTTQSGVAIPATGFICAAVAFTHSSLSPAGALDMRSPASCVSMGDLGGK